MSGWRRAFRLVRPSAEVDVGEEVHFHLESRTVDLEAQGMGREAARAQALEEFGDPQAFRRELVAIDRRMAARRRRSEQWYHAVQELRYAARRIARQPGFSVPALSTLVIGIGAAAALFTVLQQVVLAPLPYPDPDRLVRLRSAVPGVGNAHWGLAKAQFLYYERETRSFEALALYRIEQTPVGSGADARVAAVALTSSGMAPALGARMARGRALRPADGFDAAEPVVVLSHRTWRRDFEGSESILGRTLRVDGIARTVVGVLEPGVRLPEEFALPGDAAVELWVPLPLDPSEVPRNNHTYRALGRLQPHASLQAAHADLSRLSEALPSALPQAYTATFMRETGFSPALEPLRDALLGTLGRVLWILFGAALLVLLVACANVTNLFLARHEVRRHELTVRAALGAGRRSIALYLLGEAWLIALPAGALGLALAGAGLRVLVTMSPSDFPRAAEVHLGLSTVAAVFLFAMAAGTLLGLLPVWRIREGPAALADSGRGSPAPARAALRRALVVAQVALSLVLLAGAGLLLRSFRGLTAVPTGIDAREVLTFNVALPWGRYQAPAAFAEFYLRMLDRMRQVPGIQEAAVATALPMSGYDGCSLVVPHDAGLEPRGQPPCLPVIQVSEGYFRVMGIPLRGPPPARTPALRATVTVSEAFAHRFWPAQEPVGRRLGQGWRADPEQVTAVAGDVRLISPGSAPSEVVYFPIEPLQFYTPWLSPFIRVVLRAPGATVASHGPLIRQAVGELDSEVPVMDLQPMQAIVEASMTQERFAMSLLGLASAAALALSLLGLYGVISYLVSQRLLELSIRLALGARADAVGRLVLWQSFRLALTGIVLGLAATIGLTRLLQSQLFGVSPTDPLTLGGVAALLVVLTGAASWVPARRAMRTEPIRALRSS